MYESANLILCMTRICDEELYEISIFSPKILIHSYGRWDTWNHICCFFFQVVDVLNEICKENIDPICMIEILLSRLTLKRFSTVMKWQVIIFLRAYYCFATENLVVKNIWYWMCFAATILHWLRQMNKKNESDFALIDLMKWLNMLFLFNSVKSKCAMVSTYIDDLFHSVNGVFVIIILCYFFFFAKMCPPNTLSNKRIFTFIICIRII